MPYIPSSVGSSPVQSPLSIMESAKYYLPGAYYGPPAIPETAGGDMTNGVLRGGYVPISKTTTFDRISINHFATTGSSGSVVRLGIYRVDSGTLWTLILDAGTVDTSTAPNRKEITIAQQLTSGMYVLVSAGQGAPVTTPSLSRIASPYGAEPYMHATGWNTNFANFPRGFSRSGITGAFPSTLTIDRSDFENSNDTPYVWIRAT